MSPPNHRMLPQLRRFPRVSGDEPRLVQGKGSYLTFSPRERG